jgi:Protein of unknown function (DUF2914)
MGLYLKFTNSITTFYQRHQVLVSCLVFGAGFSIDLSTLREIDDIFIHFLHVPKLLLLGFFLLLELKIKTSTIKLHPFWKYHDLVVHFLFGSLLSAYTIYYFNSASAVTSFIYIALLVALMLANEISKFRELGLPVRVVLFFICLLSYFSFLFPIIFSQVGTLSFWAGLTTSLLIFLGIIFINLKIIKESFQLRRAFLYPGLLTHLLFAIFYYSSLIPPVPLAIKKMGVYYEVEKINSTYLGKFIPEDRTHWPLKSYHFKARQHDKISILLAIFSPNHFKDKIHLRWWRRDLTTGWILEDTIPLQILGGRRSGYRGFGTKENYRPGEWKIIIETNDSRQLGKIDLLISKDSTDSNRQFASDRF